MLSVVINYLKDDIIFGKQHATLVMLGSFALERLLTLVMFCEDVSVTGGKHLSEISRVESSLNNQPSAASLHHKCYVKTNIKVLVMKMISFAVSLIFEMIGSFAPHIPTEISQRSDDSCFHEKMTVVG